MSIPIHLFQQYRREQYFPILLFYNLDPRDLFLPRPHVIREFHQIEIAPIERVDIYPQKHPSTGYIAHVICTTRNPMYHLLVRATPSQVVGSVVQDGSHMRATETYSTELTKEYDFDEGT